MLCLKLMRLCCVIRTKVKVWDDDEEPVCAHVRVCVSRKAFGLETAERSSFLLLCNLIGKIQAAARTHSLRHTQSPSKTHMLSCTTQICSICAQTGHRHMLLVAANKKCACVFVCVFVCVQEFSQLLQAAIFLYQSHLKGNYCQKKGSNLHFCPSSYRDSAFGFVWNHTFSVEANGVATGSDIFL